MFLISSVVFATVTSAPVRGGMHFHSVIASSFSKIMILFIASMCRHGNHCDFSVLPLKDPESRPELLCHVTRIRSCEFP